MKINLSPEVSEDLTELRLIAGYESTQALIRILLKLYKDDFKGRFERGVIALAQHSTTSFTQKPNSIAAQVHPPSTQQALATPNPPPEW